MGRSGVRFSAVLPVSTSPAPNSPSTMTNISDSIDARSASLLFTLRSLFQRLYAQTARTIINSPANELVMRCENSITVFSSGADGITSPPQVNQCCPHPSPDFDARKNTPHRITTIFHASTNQAYFANPLNLDRSCITESVEPIYLL